MLVNENGEALSDDEDYGDDDDEDELDVKIGKGKGKERKEPGRVYMVGPNGRVKLLEKGVQGYSDSMERKLKKMKLDSA